MLFYKRTLLYPPNTGDRADFNKLYAAYLQHLESIKPKLTESAWKLARLTFHDARVSSVSQPSKHDLTITLDGGYLGFGYDFITDQPLNGRRTDLVFTRVKKAWVPDTIVGDYWLYEEVNLSEIAAFDYQALLEHDEIRIQADDVHIQSYNGPVKK